MTRIRQFANDLGIPYSSAKKLIMEGRRRNDRGSDIMRRYKDGGASTKVEDKTPPKPDFDFGRTIGGGRMVPKVPGKLIRRGDDEKVETKAMGGTHKGGCGCAMCDGDMVRGMGKAYMGNPRTAKIR